MKQYRDELVENGLDAVNISLDTLDKETYRNITGFDELGRVIESIDLAVKKGLPVKINSVLQKGVNESEWKNLIEIARLKKIDVRFIEMMPIGYGKQLEAVSGEELQKEIEKEYPDMEKDITVHGNGPAVYYKIPGFSGSVGFISAIHGKFCESCNRIRLTSTGELKPCLCYGESVNIKKVLRSQEKSEIILVEKIRNVIEETIQKKPQEHCFESLKMITEDKQMVQIGG